LSTHRQPAVEFNSQRQARGITLKSRAQIPGIVWSDRRQGKRIGLFRRRDLQFITQPDRDELLLGAAAQLV
jgi:hypothetical protein